MLWVCTEIDHSKQVAALYMPWFCSHHLFMSPVIYCWTNVQEHGIYLLNETCQWYKNWLIIVTHDIFLWKLVSISNKILYFSQKLFIIDFVSWACSELTFWLHLQHNKSCFKAYETASFINSNPQRNEVCGRLSMF